MKKDKIDKTEKIDKAGKTEKTEKTDKTEDTPIRETTVEADKTKSSEDAVYDAISRYYEKSHKLYTTSKLRALFKSVPSPKYKAIISELKADGLIKISLGRVYPLKLIPKFRRLLLASYKSLVVCVLCIASLFVINAKTEEMLFDGVADTTNMMILQYAVYALGILGVLAFISMIICVIFSGSRSD